MTRISNCVECGNTIESDGSRGPVSSRCLACKGLLRREQNARRKPRVLPDLPRFED